MGDIYLGLLILAVLDVALFVAGRVVAQRLSLRRRNGLAAVVFLLVAVYASCVWDHVVLARLLPFSNLIVIGNWCPLAAGWLSGLASLQSVMPSWRRWLSIIGLQGAALMTVCATLIGSAPQCGHDWDSTGVCFQTTNMTCSAAAAATLLKRYGIDTTEQEMAELCLTRDGTNWMGLYRGLKKKTAGTRWDVEAFTCSADELRRSHPAIITIGLEPHAKVDLFLQAELGIKPGVRHSVVLLSFQDDRWVTIAEPTPGFGQERWTIDELQQFYRGLGLRLVSRNGTAKEVTVNQDF